MIATAPGKLIVSGEYAVLDGASALVIAVDRRVIARSGTGGDSVFLDAVRAEIASRGFATREIVVDSSALYDGTTKLGLGSSAAVTVAAVALSRGIDDLAHVLDIALAAHAAAQQQLGAAGSGADVAAAVYGGVIRYMMNRQVEHLAWPDGVHLVPFFTGHSADTATLVAAVTANRDTGALDRIARASQAACETTDPTRFIAALDEDGLAVGALGPLVPDVVRDIRAQLVSLGGTAKTTGAGGGDVAIAIAPESIDASEIRRVIEASGCRVLDLTVDRGVDIRPNPA